MSDKPVIKSSLPKFDDLILDQKEAFLNDQFNALVNNDPPKNWLKLHPASTEKKKITYLPIDKVEFLLTKIFGAWSVEVIEFKQLAQSISCQVRLHMKHPMTGEKLFFDGVGAVPIQVNKDQSPADLMQIKSNAIQIGLPSAKSYAIKDAAEHIGKLFGRDMNREGAILSDAYVKIAERWTPEEERIKQRIEACKTLSEVEELQKNNPDFPVDWYELRKEAIRENTEL